MSIYKKTGALLFGTRLKRLSDKFISDLSKVYKNENIQFEVAWFPVFYLLDENHEVTISSIARLLEITHSGASQMVTSLKKKGFVQISQVREDKRSKMVSLTAQGEEKLREIKPVWHVLQESMEDMAQNAGEGVNILRLLEKLEQGMERFNLAEVVHEKLMFKRFLEQIDIVEYSDRFHESFMTLVLNWISENPGTVPEDIDWINHTQKEVFEHGNAVIFMAAHLGEIISACVATIDQKTLCSELTLILERRRVSNNIIQVLLERMVSELEKRNITVITTKIDITHSEALKKLQKNKFKLMEIEKGVNGDNMCTRLSRVLKKEEQTT